MEAVHVLLLPIEDMHMQHQNITQHIRSLKHFAMYIIFLMQEKINHSRKKITWLRGYPLAANLFSHTTT